ncbi:hypothetical protein ACFQRC_13410 [Enterovirga sp. GCM10030262]|uniref:hypothetical protein n=1 Tax=Enterovirga sp. GCM10030262 TaxID=3273391 RepID=UPI00361C30BD
MKTHILAAAILAASFASPASAGTQDFVILNNTGYTIKQLHVAASTKDVWEEDVLGSEILEDGERTRVRFDSDEESCLWDIKVTYDDGETAAWQGVNLCEISIVSLRYDHETGSTSAEAE